MCLPTWGVICRPKPDIFLFLTNFLLKWFSSYQKTKFYSFLPWLKDSCVWLTNSTSLPGKQAVPGPALHKSTWDVPRTWSLSLQTSTWLMSPCQIQTANPRFPEPHSCRYSKEKLEDLISIKFTALLGACLGWPILQGDSEGSSSRLKGLNRTFLLLKTEPQ